MDFTVVCVQSENSGNIGAIARCMANFDLSRLILVDPLVDHLNEEAVSRSKRAKNILENSVVKPKSYLERGESSIFHDFDTVIGTTSVLGSDYNLPRIPLLPEDLSSHIQRKSAIIFGRDGTGLRNDELEQCDLIVAIPSSKKYPALNISHAAAILFYELYKTYGYDKLNSHILSASRKEREVILDKINLIIDKTDFSTPEKKETQRLAWKNFVNKSFLSKREAFAVLGLLRKLK